MPIRGLAKLNRPAQNSIFAALTVIAAVAIYSWLVTPHVNCLFAAQRYDSAVNKLEEKSTTLAHEIELETKRLQKLSGQFAQARNKLFTPEQAKEFFGNLQAASEETGCTVHLLNLGVNKSRNKNKRPKDVSDIVTNSAILSVSGQYNNIVKLVEGLQNHVPRVWVDSFKIEVVDFNAGLLRCDMTITVHTLQEKGDAL